jgi:ribosomal protein S18 acetylase RimI-like enzyme
MEFLARCGPGFLRTYHRAWIASPDGLALAAVDAHGAVVGVLLGATRPAAHYRFVVRRHGLALAGRLVLSMVARPSLARELVATRLSRYLRGLGRMAMRPRRRTPRALDGSGPPPRPEPGIRERPSAQAVAAGEVTHVMVSPSAQGTGAGRALVEAAQRVAAEQGLDELVLVTPPDLTAGAFYEHLGWQQDGTLASRSGESFVRYRRRL